MSEPPWPAQSRYGESLAQTTDTDGQGAIMLMGLTGSGKSSFIASLTGRNEGVGHSLNSYTTAAKAISYRFRSEDTNSLVYLIDTPGFDDSERSNTLVLQEIAAFLQVLRERDIPLYGVVYLHRISDPRIGAASNKSLRVLEKVCGKAAFKNVVLGSTMWDQVPEDIGASREKSLTTEDEYWGKLIQGNALPVRLTSTRDNQSWESSPNINRSQNTSAYNNQNWDTSTHDTQNWDTSTHNTQNWEASTNKIPSWDAYKIVDHLIRQNESVILEIQYEIEASQEFNLRNTTAGQYLESDIHALREQFKMEKAQLQAAMEEAISDRNRNMEHLLKTQLSEGERRLQRTEADLAGISKSLGKLEIRPNIVGVSEPSFIRSKQRQFTPRERLSDSSLDTKEAPTGILRRRSGSDRRTPPQDIADELNNAVAALLKDRVQDMKSSSQTFKTHNEQYTSIEAPVGVPTDASSTNWYGNQPQSNTSHASWDPDIVTIQTEDNQPHSYYPQSDGY